MLVFFSASGDLGYLWSLIDDDGLSTKIVDPRELARDIWSVRYFTYRITA
jgi:hypothetical protein